MKKTILSLLFSLTIMMVFSQGYYSVYGKVISNSSKLPLQGASVFAQNTTLGTATDAEGNFKLNLPNGGYELAITFTGYNTEIKRINSADANDKTVIYELSERERQMEGVAVVATSEVKDGWNKYGDFFLEKFIGKTQNSALCTIKNKEALKFYFSRKRNRLKVLATETLEIENAALGYKIKYNLDSFTHEYNTQVSLYTGYPLFEEMVTEDSAQKAKWETARVDAYLGSMLHFMRSLYDKTLKEQGFEIQFLADVNGKETALPLKDYYAALHYMEDDSTQLVQITPAQAKLGIIYLDEKPTSAYMEKYPEEPADFQFSTLSFLPNGSMGIEQNGYYFDQNDIVVSAYWTWERIADQLPYNYLPAD